MHSPSLQWTANVLMYRRTVCREVCLMVRENVLGDGLYDLKCALAPRMVEHAPLMHEQDWPV